MFGYTNRVVFFEVTEDRAEVIFFENAVDETGGVFLQQYIYTPLKEESS